MSLAACSTQSTQSNALTSITPEDLQERNEALLTKEAELTRREAEFADAKSYSATSNTMVACYHLGLIVANVTHVHG